MDPNESHLISSTKTPAIESTPPRAISSHLLSSTKIKV
jgi:hypothetical protein